MLTVYHLESSRSERIIWFVEELGVPYKLEKFRREGYAAPDALRALHPLGRAPLLRDGDTLLVESGAIMQYVLARYGGGKLSPPAESPDYPRFLQWLHFAEGTAMMNLFPLLFLERIPADTPGSARERVAARVERDFAYIDGHLGAHAYFAGQSFTAADINMHFPIRFASGWMKRDLTRHPNLSAWIERVAARPAFRKAMSLA